MTSEPQIDNRAVWATGQVLDSDAKQRERQRVLSALANSDFARVEPRVAYLLRTMPATRDSHTRLAIEYWRKWNAKEVESFNDLDVLMTVENYENIERVARHLQNTLLLWPAIADFAALRQARQLSFAEYLQAVASQPFQIRLYLDETGSDDRGFYAYAGICILEWKLFAAHHAAFQQWRKDLNHPETLHACDAVADTSLHLQMLNWVDHRKGGLVFVGHTLISRQIGRDAKAALFCQVVLDVLRFLQENACLNKARELLVVKEADDGLDKIYLPLINKELSRHIGTEFPQQVCFREVQSVPKGREVMLELADVVAYGLARGRKLRSRHPKDVLAQASLNVSGLDDCREKGVVVFKQW